MRSGRRWVMAALMVGGLVAAVGGRVALGSYEAFSRAEGLAAEGRSELAALGYREAITWYFPGNPFVTRAIERMWALADAAEGEGDFVGARIIVGELRGALFAIRSVWQPHAYELGMASDRLAILLAETDERVGPTVDPASLLPEYREDVARDHAPSAGWSLALVLAFGGWVLLSFLGIARLIPDGEGALRWRGAAPWMGGSFVCLAVWLWSAASA